MTGHEPIIALRLQGLHPPEIIVTDLPSKGLPNTVCIDADDVVEALDLRFLTGTLCHVSASETPRGQRIADMCAEYATRTVASFYAPENRRSVRLTDTQERRQWKF